jgi:SAM-dependent methyltransferase
MELPAGAALLDYGCAKGAVFRRLREIRPDLELSLFDVSARYTAFWKDFLAPSRWATHHPDPAWEESFDVVTSFFSLEHVADPVAFMGKVSGLLKEGGSFYCVVPDISQNAADFLVVDHVNHFSQASLRFLLEHAGFVVTDLDSGAHRGAFVTVAERRGGPAAGGYDIAGAEKRARETSRFWSELGERVRRFEGSAPHRGKAAIYGSGFYGTYIAASLDSLEKVACFFDRNPHRQGKTVMGKPVVSPDEIPAGVETLYVGLNPDIARAAVEEAFGDRLDAMRCFII